MARTQAIERFFGFRLPAKLPAHGNEKAHASSARVRLIIQVN